MGNWTKRHREKVIFGGIVLGMIPFFVLAAYIFAGILSTMVVNGEEIQVTKSGIASSYENYYKEHHRIFLNRNLDKACVTYKFDTKPFDTMSGTDKMVSLLTDKDITIRVVVTVSKKKLKEWVHQYNEDLSPSKDAKIEFSDKGRPHYEIIPETYGETISEESLYKLYLDGERLIREDKGLIKPSVKEADLTDATALANDYLIWSVSYKDGPTITVPKSAVKVKKNKVKIKNDFLEDAVIKVENSFNTYGGKNKFKDHDGHKRSVKGGTWGNTVDSDKELDILNDLFKNHKSMTDRKPEYSAYMGEIGKTFIEVSIEDQHLWVHKKGKIVMDTDVVTGAEAKGRGTPTGAYFISEKVPGKYLVGDSYKTWVNRWMRLTDAGVGLHDAYWRGNFGGDIYHYSGSHGCVNLPKDFAYDLYEKVHVNEAVVIY